MVFVILRLLYRKKQGYLMHVNDGRGEITCLLLSRSCRLSTHRQMSRTTTDGAKLTGFASQGSAGLGTVARAVYGKDARYKQGMTGRSMAARASWPRPPVYRTAYALVDGERGDLVERIVNSDQTVHTEPIARPRRQSASPLAALARR